MGLGLYRASRSAFWGLGRMVCGARGINSRALTGLYSGTLEHDFLALGTVDS